MLITELFETFQDLRPHRLTLRTDPDTPGALRLLDSDSRQLIGLVRSPADFLRLVTPRHVSGSAINIKVPPAVYTNNRELIDNLQKFAHAARDHRQITFDLQTTIKEVTLDEVQQPHLYLDMDGVQADFFTAWAQWHNQKFGQSHVERYKDIGSKEQREQSIAELSAEGPEFIERYFATLPTLPGGQRLIRWLRQNRIPFTVLSAPLRGMHEPSIAGKRTWLDAHNPGTSEDAIFTGTKERYATTGGRPNVLVDDFKKYINAWTASGGLGILYRDADVDGVIRQLAEIYQVPMREAQDFQSHGARLKTYLVTLKIDQGAGYQRMDTTVVARTPEQAKRMISQQYGRNIVVGRPREMR